MKIVWNWLFKSSPYNIFMILWFGKKKAQFLPTALRLSLFISGYVQAEMLIFLKWVPIHLLHLLLSNPIH